MPRTVEEKFFARFELNESKVNDVPVFFRGGRSA